MDMDNEDNIDNGEYYIVRKKAVPQVLVDVVRAKQLIESGKAESVQEAISRTGISRSYFTNIRMIFFLFMRARGERHLH